MITMALIIALAVLFLHSTTWEGMIFHKVSVVLNEAPDWVKKPLFDCPICMTPWWGAIMIIAGELTGQLPCIGYLREFAVLFAAAGMNVIFIYVVSLCRDYVIQVNSHENEDIPGPESNN